MMIERFVTFIGNARLRPTVALALILGLTLPVSVSVWRDLGERHDTLMGHLRLDHARLVELLAIGMQTPIWDVRPDTGRPLIDTLMRDERVTSVTVRSTLTGDFLRANDPLRRHGEIFSLESPVVRDGERIGAVRVEMSTASLEAEIRRQGGQVLVTGLLQLACGMMILFPLLRFKVLSPVDRLVRHSRILAGGGLDQSLRWRRSDELGVLGRSFEEMRKSLRRVVTDLETRNRELQAREIDLNRRRQTLRAILDNMTDGITLVDEDLRLRSWNGRFLEIMGLPKELVQDGMHIDELIAFDIARRRYASDDSAEIKRTIFESYRPGYPRKTEYVMANGQHVDVRRRPVPGGGFVSTYTDVTEQFEARRRADQTLRLLEAIMDAVPAVLHVKDRELRYRFVNRQFPSWWGATRSEVIGKTNREVFPPHMFVETDARDRQVIETGKPIPFYEGLCEHPDHDPIVSWTSKLPLFDSDGEVSHILTVDFDITDRKRMEQERQRWLQLLQDAVESIDNGFAVFDRSGELVICNNPFAAVYGETADQLVGATAEGLLPRFISRCRTLNGQPAEVAAQSMHETFNLFWSGSGEPIEIEFKDGRWMMLNRHASQEGGLVIIRTDITDLKNMQQALRESEQRFRGIVETHPVPIAILSQKDCQILYGSPGLLELLQISEQELAGPKSFEDFVDSECHETMKTAIKASGTLSADELSLKRADGSEVEVAVTARPIHYEGLQALLASFLDLTERKKAEAELERHREALHQSEKLGALGALLAGVAHELNNPLSVVVGRAIMLEDSLGATEHAVAVARLRRAAERCTRIVRTFLAMARRQETTHVVVHWSDVVQAALDLVGYGLRTGGIDLSVDIDENLPTLHADPDQLTQVVVNLVVNAQQALASVPEPRRLRISAKYHPQSETIETLVTDNGPGVPPSLLPRIFEPFFTTKPVGEGTGLGLSVSDGIVRAHGGTIAAELRDSGGMAFHISLPAGGLPGEEIAEEVTDLGIVESKRILVVDDEPEIAMMLGDILTSDGHQVSFAGSGREALEQIMDDDFDLVITDVRMPDLDGPGLFREIQSVKPALAERTVFVTGDTLSTAAKAFFSETERPVLEKPFTPGEARRVVGRVIDDSEDS